MCNISCHIPSVRVSGAVKSRLERRKVGDESLNAVVDRLLDDDAEWKREQIEAGFGAFGNGDATRLSRELRRRSKAEQRERWAENDEEFSGEDGS